MNTRKLPSAPQSDALTVISNRAVELSEANRNLWNAVNDDRDLGLSWSHIADCLGTSPQAAHERFSKPAPGRLI